ncbi:unnamed protein product, partial [Ixodes persulcatus]
VAEANDLSRSIRSSYDGAKYAPAGQQHVVVSLPKTSVGGLCGGGGCPSGGVPRLQSGPPPGKRARGTSSRQPRAAPNAAAEQSLAHRRTSHGTRDKSLRALLLPGRGQRGKSAEPASPSPWMPAGVLARDYARVASAVRCEGTAGRWTPR